MIWRTKFEPTQNSKSKCMTLSASNIQSGSRQMASVLRANFTKADSPNSWSYLPRSRQLDLQILIRQNCQPDHRGRNHKPLGLLSNSRRCWRFGSAWSRRDVRSRLMVHVFVHAMRGACSTIFSGRSVTPNATVESTPIFRNQKRAISRDSLAMTDRSWFRDAGQHWTTLELGFENGSACIQEKPRLRK